MRSKIYSFENIFAVETPNPETLFLKRFTLKRLVLKLFSRNALCHPERGRMPESKDPDNARVNSAGWSFRMEHEYRVRRTLYIGVTSELDLGVCGAFESSQKNTVLPVWYNTVFRAISNEKQWKDWRRSKRAAANAQWKNLYANMDERIAA